MHLVLSRVRAPLALSVLLAIPGSLLAQDARPDQPGFKSPGISRQISAAHFGSSPFDPPEENDTNFVVDTGGGLDTGCTFRDGSPLVFNIKVDRVLDDASRDKLKANGLISPTATLRMPAFDVDFDAVVPPYNPERDRVTFNGNVVPTTFLTGSNNVWKLNAFNVPIEWVKFASDPGEGGEAQPMDNEIRIDIDTANGELVWCTAIDWAALSFEMARPTIMAHGILSEGGIWNNVWVPQLQNLGIYTDNNLNMGNLDSIGNNAGKIGVVVDRNRKRWGVDKVNIVCHSKGGLDSRHYVENRDTVDRIIQLGTPNAGSPLADFGQGVAIGLLGGLPTLLINALAGPAGIQLTTPYMATYNAFHGHNPDVEYNAVAGDYDPDCPWYNPFCGQPERLMLSISGRGDTIVPLWSVHALSYARNRTFPSSGGNKDATHGGLHGSMAVFNGYGGPVRQFGRPLRLAAAAEIPFYGRTASVGGEIAQGDVVTQLVPVEENRPVLFSVFYGDGEVQVDLVTPSGQRIDPSVAAADPDIDYENAAVEGGRVAVYGLNQTEVGIWTVEVRGGALASPVAYAVHAWIETPAITFAGSFARPAVAAGDPIDLAGTVREAGAPVPGATVVARVVRPDGSFVDVTLVDDGAGTDATAGDGVYSARLTGTEQAGLYKVAFTARGTRSTGAVFSREDFGLATASAGRSTFTGFRDAGRDTNGNSLFDKLAVDVDLNVTAAGTYRVYGELTDSAGNRQEVSTLATLPAGAATATLLFDGKTLFQNRVNGPYTLSVIRIAEESGLNLLPVAEVANAHQTAAYSYLQFEHTPLRLTGNGTATGIDFNGNGLYDRLDVTVEIEADRSGFYQWSGQLRDVNGRELGFIARSAFFNVGRNVLTFSFDGATIGRNGVDGPYFITDLLVFGAGLNLVAARAFETPAFLASQFEGYTADNTPPTITVTLDPSVLWPPDHRMVEVAANVTVTDNKDPNPTVELVSIDSNEPDNAIGDGNTVDDVQGAEPGTDDRSFQLRAERSGTGGARIYNITYRARDAAGNTATATATVRVPHNQGH
jgi:hypothetical protein